MCRVRYADVPDVPWANGGGSTRLLWSDAPGERRISVAMLERPARFSVLPDIARLLMVLDPVVVELEIGGDRRTLRRRDTIAFAGSDPVALVALGRPGRVLNLICRADRWSPWIDHDTPDPVGRIEFPGGDLILGTYPSPGSIGIGFLPVDPLTIIP